MIENKEDLFNPCLEYCQNHFGKQYTSECDSTCEFAKAVKENEMIKEEINTPVKTLPSLAFHFCSMIECENYPVCIYNYETRTKEEKELLHVCCAQNLYKWIKDTVTDYVKFSSYEKYDKEYND